jgi:hypothetical protein
VIGNCLPWRSVECEKTIVTNIHDQSEFLSMI